MLSILGLINFSRHHRELLNEEGMKNLQAQLAWITAAEEAFIRLKQEMAIAADLSTPDYNKPFYLYTSATDGIVNGIIFQKKIGDRKVLQYLSIKVYATKARHALCTGNAAGIAHLLQKRVHIVRGHSLLT